MKGKIVVAADLGASGGKMARGGFDGERLEIGDYYDFPNQPLSLNGNLYWRLFELYQQILGGLAHYAGEGQVASVAVDTWGASYGFLDRRGRLLEPVYHYRDLRTERSLERMYQILPRRELFALTGCQPSRTYTLPQLYSYIEHGDQIIGLAEHMLLLPDLIGYFLTGEISTERSIAGTSGCMRPEQDGWAYEVFDALGIPSAMLTGLVDTGAKMGVLLPEAAAATGAGKVSVIAAPGHDTASAVTGIPGFGVNQVYISAGTNVNMGIELCHSVVSDQAFQGGFKNASVIGKRRILYRDFAAFWLLSELRRTWEEEGKRYGWQDIMDMVRGRGRAYIDVEDDGCNNAGGSMKQKINAYLKRTGQKELAGDEAFASCILESIALKVKYCTEFLARELGVPVRRVSVVNGGCRNHVLLQMISDALGMPVYGGLPYATLAGNILTQLYALGEVGSVDEIRELSQNSFAMREYLPRAGEKAGWDEDLQRMVEQGVCQ